MSARPVIAAIAAVAENYVIGADGDLPWRLPADLRWFVRNTKNKPIISGRKTYESTGYLKNRTNIVVTRDHSWASDCDIIAHSIDDAIAAVDGADEVMILGGATIYEALMPRLDRLYLTVVHASPDGDTWFPPLDPDQWRVDVEEFRAPDEKNPLPMTFFVLQRIEYGELDGERKVLPSRFRRAT